MQEKNGAAYCASDFAGNGCPPRTVCAAPVFVPVTMDTDALPLAALYNHPDFIDLISAQEFGLEQTKNDRLLLCVVVAAAREALEQLTALIVPPPALTPRAVCREQDGVLQVEADHTPYALPAAEQAGALLAAMQQQAVSLPGVLAALTTWCTGYGCTLYGEADL